MPFQLTTAEFTGPIEALLQLIEKRKLPINDISLAEVTDEYLKFVTTLPSDDSIANKIHFIYVASTLTLIKSKSLLPSLDLSPEEEEDIEKLKKRLLQYQHYQEIAKGVKQQFSTKPQFVMAKEKAQFIRFSPHKGIDLVSLKEALHEVFTEVPEPIQTKKEAHISIAVHIEELMDDILDRIKKFSSVNFGNFMKSGQSKHEHPKKQKVYAVVSFLALLEVVRNHGISVQQDGLFEDIEVQSHS
jgi:segregation and condensation protein A